MDGDEWSCNFTCARKAVGLEAANEAAKKGSSRITLAKGQSQQVKFVLPAASLAFWDTPAKKYAVEQGGYEVMVGASSEDIRVKGEIIIK